MKARIKHLARLAWMCRCGTSNGDDDSNCGGCGTPW